MNDISVLTENIVKEPWMERVEPFIQEVLKLLERDEWEFSVTLCDNEYIHILNRDYRQKDCPTDVITFAMCDEPFPVVLEEGEKYNAGDIIISLDTIKENSVYFKVSEDEELKRVIIHGVLHLDGMDHETNDPGEQMLIKQEEILKKLEGRIILDK